MQQSFYEVKQQYDAQREKADILYRCFMSKDTRDLNKILQEIKNLTLAEFPQASKRLRAMMERAETGDSRIAKHAMLLFGLYLTPTYAKKLVDDALVDPQRFQYYYQYHLPLLCQDHLNGKPRVDSLQAFVEEARTRYIII